MDISIVITTYNYQNYIRESLESCLNQETDLDYEVIVVNDGSTDKTQEILDNYKNHAKLTLVEIDNSGIEKASNIGFSIAKGNFIVRLDADDLLLLTFLDSYSDLLQDNQYDFFYSDYFVIDALGRLTEEMSLPEYSKQEIFSRGDFLATGTIYRREIFDRFGGYEDSIVNSGLENYEFILRLINNGSLGKHLEKKLFKYRRHQKNLSNTQKNKIIENGHNLFAIKNYGSFSTNKYHPYQLEIENMKHG